MSLRRGSVCLSVCRARLPVRPLICSPHCCSSLRSCSRLDSTPGCLHLCGRGPLHLTAKAPCNLQFSVFGEGLLFPTLAPRACGPWGLGLSSRQILCISQGFGTRRLSRGPHPVQLSSVVKCCVSGSLSPLWGQRFYVWLTAPPHSLHPHLSLNSRSDLVTPFLNLQDFSFLS